MSKQKTKTSKSGGKTTNNFDESLLSEFENEKNNEKIKKIKNDDDENIDDSDDESDNESDDDIDDTNNTDEETTETLDFSDDEDTKNTKKNNKQTKLKNNDDQEENQEENQESESCLYNIRKRKSSKILESEPLDDTFFEEEKIILTKKIVPNDERITKPILTKYERVRILSERRQQLIYGAKPMVKVNDLISEKDIATLELQHKVIPFIIVRTLPNGKIEHWKLSELEIIN